ncbi:regulator of G protein signaling [Tilletiaria anomala UBC 951]|uniref:Regulator of G protein signaling n=1 Tax=Tilletiaria anomala (strain ATCC 24038 / CBS 436.72 / UBC 951) TaxID=1037660 RepID=A0A066VET1_TILAU|nr:regulator of G protein signaling [Tilletiaria anomala UBC 951]KDN39956.1 regulator of G protein signaling [Tilletiaria anomala UBC 951]
MSEKRRSFHLQSSQSRQRLPTLAEVLARRTAPPVDLYCFYLFLQREGAEDSLDFWLDVQQHENLCRAYFKDLRKSGRSVKDDWPGYWREARERGSIYNKINGVDEDIISADAAVLETGALGQKNASGEEHEQQHRGDFESAAQEGQQGTVDEFGGNRPSTSMSHGPRFPGDPDFPPQATRSERRSMLAKRASLAPTVISRNAAITRTDLIASAERIYARYLLPGSEKEIYLPSTLRINSFPISSNALPHPQDEESQQALARVPDMFHAPKEYVFRTMEADIFPRFLRAKAFGNLTPISSLVRLILGLLALWAALATGFSFIFLDVHRQKRLWVILPFSIAVLLLFSHQYELDPLLVILFCRSETTPFKTINIHERYVRSLLYKRALGILALVTLVTSVLTVIFVFVPGHRL